jgi:ferric-dicitrate binding protein FerR (iron transport regulator)
MTGLRALFIAAAVVASSHGTARAQGAENAQGAEKAQPAAGAMTVSLLEGNATAAQAGTVAQPLAVGAVLHEGDVIETAPGGRLEISFANGTLLRVGESSRIHLREAPVSGGAFRARLLLGNLWAKVHKLIAGEHFEVETENAVAGVRGTEFRVEAAGGKGEDLVRVYEGAVEVKHAGWMGGAWSHRVEPNRELRISRDKAPAGPAEFSAASDAKHPFMSWVRARSEARGPGAPGTKPGAAPGGHQDGKTQEPGEQKKHEPGEQKKHEPGEQKKHEPGDGKKVKDPIKRDRKADLRDERRRRHL